MKLYPEEQVKKAISMAYTEYHYEQIIDSLTPIELPSDEQIRAKGWDDADIEDDLAFYIGAKWMKEQILNQNK